MLDIKFIRENVDLIRDTVKKKRVDVNIGRFLELDEKRRMLIQGYEEGLAKKNKASKIIAATETPREKQKLILLRIFYLPVNFHLAHRG